MSQRRYETMLLLDPEQGEAGLKETLGRITTLISDQGGVIGQEHDWGMRELSYPIRKHKRARYALLEFHSTPTALTEIERNLKLMEPVLRFLSVRQDENAPPANLHLAETRPDESADGPKTGKADAQSTPNTAAGDEASAPATAAGDEASTTPNTAAGDEASAPATAAGTKASTPATAAGAEEDA